jgi:hypothetical protein
MQYVTPNKGDVHDIRLIDIAMNQFTVTHGEKRDGKEPQEITQAFRFFVSLIIYFC